MWKSIVFLTINIAVIYWKLIDDVKFWEPVQHTNDELEQIEDDDEFEARMFRHKVLVDQDIPKYRETMDKRLSLRQDIRNMNYG